MKVLEQLLDTHADKVSLQQTIRKKISSQDNDDAFFLCDLGTVIQQHEEWTRLCPGIEPFYAVKCNNDPALLQSLASLGTGFDCASRAEIEQVLSLGVAPERIIFANPCKMKSHIEFARDQGVAMMTFDDEHEMEKIRKHYPEAKLVLRILPPPSKAQCNLGCKYGVLPDRAPELVTKAVQMEMNLVGVRWIYFSIETCNLSNLSQVFTLGAESWRLTPSVRPSLPPGAYLTPQRRWASSWRSSTSEAASPGTSRER